MPELFLVNQLSERRDAVRFRAQAETTFVVKVTCAAGFETCRRALRRVLRSREKPNAEIIGEFVVVRAEERSGFVS